MLYDSLWNILIKFKGGGLGNLPHWRDKIRTRASKFLQLRHNEFVAVPLKKPDDAGYPKCPVCVFTDVPVDTPLLKVYDYGPFGARFFGTPFCPVSPLFLGGLRCQCERYCKTTCPCPSERMSDTIGRERHAQVILNQGIDANILI